MQRYLVLTFFYLCLLTSPAMAQKSSPEGLARDYIFAKRADWHLSESDLTDLRINDQYRSRHNGVTHLFFQQYHQGIPVFQALAGIHISPEGQVVFASHRFEADLIHRVKRTTPKISHHIALRTMAKMVQSDTTDMPTVQQQDHPYRVQYRGGSISSHPITLNLQYVPRRDGQLHLCWSATLVDPQSPEAWLIHLDAQTGKLVDRQSIVVSCSFDHQNGHCMALARQATYGPAVDSPARPPLQDGARYRVFPIPVESPIFGQRELVVDPADLTASPFGWHDNNGREGADFTDTRGNNVFAYLDVLPDNRPDESGTAEGGPDLNFDFPLDLNQTPDKYEDAVLAQLFYMNNIMHDFSYHYGFDEPAGNFQEDNYGNGGRESDAVDAEAQDGSGLNNANFLTLADGELGRMQMFLWASAIDSNRLLISSPSLAGTPDFPYGSSAFGPLLRAPVSGQIVQVVSAEEDPTLSCQTITNTDEIAGQIALINRGGCTFEEKALNAEAAGAIGVVIGNNQEALFLLGDVDTIPNPNIPTIIVERSTRDIIQDALLQGPVSVTIGVPDYIDSGFDNGVIAHEYAHGISNRLTGGPAEPFCLFNDEQMGEGWSDFFTLVMTVRPGDDGTLPRGIGNYVIGNGQRGPGIRRQPYSTNFSINNQTYDDVIGTFAPHPLGEIWAATLWDLYWALTERYGWDPDLYTGTGGNNLAIQLVMDGMKLQNCQPGFIDARDAIIAADAINNNGANECLIWEVFARRGLGWNARQGSTANRNDNVENFAVRPECIQTLKLEKTSTPNILAGAVFDVQIRVTNDKPATAQEVVVTDLIPVGTTLVPGSVQGTTDNTLDGQELRFQLGNLLPGQSVTLGYQLSSDPTIGSTLYFSDNAEKGIAGWRIRSIRGTTSWQQTDRWSNSGSRSWFIPNSLNQQDQSLQLLRPLTLSNNLPVLRFFHRFEIQPGLDGGVIELSTDGGFNWFSVPQKHLFRTPYTGRLATLSDNNRSRQAFWGRTEEWVATYVDLSEYAGQEVNFRFRFVAEEALQQNEEATEGWYIDDIEVLDVLNYATEACLTSAEGDLVCAGPSGRGTIVEPETLTTATTTSATNVQWSLYPNPGRTQVMVDVSSPRGGYQLRLLAADGRVVNTWSDQAPQLAIDLSDLLPGLYLMELTTDRGQQTQKLIIE